MVFLIIEHLPKVALLFTARIQQRYLTFPKLYFFNNIRNKINDSLLHIYVSGAIPKK